MPNNRYAKSWKEINRPPAGGLLKDLLLFKLAIIAMTLTALAIK